MYIYLAQLTLTLLITAFFTIFLKKLTKVPRRQDAVINLNDHAFPSGHTSMSFCLVTFYTFFILDLPIDLFSKIMLIGVLILAAIFIVYWRLQIKVHTPLQIFAGALIGIVVAICSVFLIK